MNSSPIPPNNEAAPGQEAAITTDLAYSNQQSATTGGVNTTTTKAQVSITPPSPSAVDFSISMVAHVRKTQPTLTTFRAVLAQIRSGKWALQIDSIRKVHAQNGKEAARPLKEALPAILFSGTFSKRNANGLVAHSGMICADLDDLKDAELPSLKQRIQSDPHTLACFVSPSGHGLKAVVRCDPQRDHGESFRAAERYFLKEFGVQIDTACSDVSRLCYVSHDPDAYVADDAKELPYPPPPEPFESPDEGMPGSRLTDGSRPGDDYNERGDYAELIKKYGWNAEKGNLWRRPGKASGASAIWNTDSRTFWVFSSNAAPLEENHLYRPWHLYALLEHNGDFRAAAKTLADQGYGGKAKQVPDQSLDLPNVLNSRRYDPSRKPQPPNPLLMLQSVTVCTPGNITTISGQAKVGKSSVVQAILAAKMAAAQPTTNCDALGFRATYSGKEKMLHFDTEQSAYDSYKLVERAVARFGGSFPQRLIESYTLAGLSAQTMRASIRLKMAEFATSPGLSLVLIDGVADLVEDVNEQKDTNALVAELQHLAISFNCAIVCVLHENPTQEGGKMRGHLGSQLERKAESNLRLKRQGETITLYGEKMRGAPIYEKDGVVFAWDPMKDRHVSIGSASAIKAQKDREKYQAEADEIMDRLNNQPARWRDVLDEICKFRKIQQSSAEDRLKRMHACGAMIQDPVTKFWTSNPV